MSMHYEDYMRQVVEPMRRELTERGFKELLTPEEVEQYMESAEGTTLVVINSVCGCAAGLARPAAVTSLAHDKHPDHLVTVFAGQEKEATAKMREYLAPNPPSSPSMALFKGKELVHFIPREEIEGAEPEALIRRLAMAYNEHCE
ncbi:BrxA/BrxB family bacilliredoxin [Halalkalibacterium halodurans]|uniref:Bacilliredoxin BH1716 n=2 Tax=Halalkalibacterium halodurans TaxID=86665 RepID=Y1716_HALH5|nr:BrxA/BrxB family bacilliredoxin [Halalkalibacterium halodurans]Q9KC58.1 RecName: Full=Bacilliredoxin BH1716 [Halalkalibacterium halodurans C-125]MDY7222285.1 BrxA/BrxB family bacilliredoxin [Halalkalibacterium halodurans]MDY7241506.1 BrxA/BrxB family bacilliredoxin [Halalkalibacterium halodurans]MED3646032.1 BrxA/BrxB family bacilliredoxin [Halalkalibacterium halodurans]MED4082410.1 BrxA/BrxB family bacilliredoxin [Halalkalibacterium halodurans]MED4083439.1 BrxA/BrxB family bacilliredoxin 